MDGLNDVTCIMYSLTLRITILPNVLSYLRYSVILVFLNVARQTSTTISERLAETHARTINNLVSKKRNN